MPRIPTHLRTTNPEEDKAKGVTWVGKNVNGPDRGSSPHLFYRHGGVGGRPGGINSQ